MARFGRRHPIQAIIKRNNVAAPVAPGAAPVPPPITTIRAAIDASSRRHTINRGRIFRGGLRPTDIPVNQRVIPQIRVDHSEKIKDKQSLNHEQQVSSIINELARKGQLRGTVNNPSLGYLADDPLDWGNDPPTTLGEALDRIAIALRSLGAVP